MKVSVTRTAGKLIIEFDPPTPDDVAEDLEPELMALATKMARHHAKVDAESTPRTRSRRRRTPVIVTRQTMTGEPTGEPTGEQAGEPTIPKEGED